MSDPHETLRADPYIGPLVERHGRLKIEPADDHFYRLVVSVLRQQVSMASAAATRERLEDAIQVTPEGVLAVDPETLRDCGLSRQKTRYVRNIAEAFAEGTRYDRSRLESLDDEALVEELKDITGVGEWTARMQLLFTFARPDVFPVGDLGVRKGMRALFEEELDREAMVERAERWKPYRSYATLYLWRIDEDNTDAVEGVDSVE